ncbi:MAG: TFIIB-type zinc ribbon-containing protein [Lachnospiraceae bacterium]|nr:TFIIB-type zinc ribbon-containing protein [Lachnospiraceae bacterium]
MICIFKCPGCNGNMTFDIEKQLLVCQSCGTEIDAEDYDEKQIVFEGGQEYGEDIICYRCPTCSAEVEVDSSQATCTCSYCGIEMAVFAGENGRMAPEKIIPFELDQGAAEVAFNKWWLEHDTMPEFNRKKMKFTIQPMYLPVWLINANTKTDMSAVVRREEMSGGTYSYSGTQNAQWSMRNDNLTFSDRDKRTRNYLIHKSLYSKFFKVPSNASYHFSSTRFFGIEPYNYMKLEDFAPGYISGLPAEHYSIEASDVIPRALKRIKGFGVEQCKTYILGSNTGESEIVEEAGCIQSIELKQVIYAMVPVWICSYTFMGKKHMVYVNGQTGKTDGEVVSSRERLNSYAVTLFLSTFLEYFVLLIFLLSMNGLDFENVAMLWGIFIAFFVGSLTGNLPNKLTRNRNGKKETVEMYADIEYVKKDFVKPGNIMIRRVAIGTLFLPIAVAFSRSPGLPSSSSPHMPEAALLSLVLSVAWTALFMGIHVKKEKEQKPAEYNDYLNMSITDILESSEHVY